MSTKSKDKGIEDSPVTDSAQKKPQKGSEIRLAMYVVGLYISFMYWGFLQEKLTSTNYRVYNGNLMEPTLSRWKYPVTLNLAMAIATYVTALVVSTVVHEKSDVPLLAFWYVL
jgi:hypothetical protein